MSQQLIIQAVDLAILGKWEDAHQIVQDLDQPYAYWIHAILHKIEGDNSNANYWYRLAKQKQSNLSTLEELQLIKSKLTQSNLKP